MKKNILNRILLVLWLSIIFVSSCKNEKDEELIETRTESVAFIDGPYVFHETDGFRIVNVNQYNEITDTFMYQVDSLLVRIPNQNPDHFYVKLNQDNMKPPFLYENVDKIFALSDIEGNYYAFVNLLIGNHITDENLNWIYGDGHVVLNGDFVDRGYYVTQVLWLIYKLEQEAAAAGGAVHFILGNHEMMNLEGNFKYVRNKYTKLADDLDISYEDFYDEKNELGRWMRSKNIIERINNNLFVHAGISNTLLNEKIDIESLNKIAKDNYGLDLENNTLTIPNLIFGSFGPLWYRGLVKDTEDYLKASMNEVNSFLDYYESEKVIIGHSIVEDISTDYDGKVIRIDLHYPDTENSTEESKALLIEDDVLYKVDVLGAKTKI